MPLVDAVVAPLRGERARQQLRAEPRAHDLLQRRVARDDQHLAERLRVAREGAQPLDDLLRDLGPQPEPGHVALAVVVGPASLAVAQRRAVAGHAQPLGLAALLADELGQLAAERLDERFLVVGAALPERAQDDQVDHLDPERDAHEEQRLLDEHLLLRRIRGDAGGHGRRRGAGLGGLRGADAGPGHDVLPVRSLHRRGAPRLRATADVGAGRAPIPVPIRGRHRWSSPGRVSPSAAAGTRACRARRRCRRRRGRCTPTRRSPSRPRRS
ncbi:hypothetical protein CMMCAS03_05950 [Clavibacter michiganensis subsp. michiganensis]|nr:hypothetical protein CMMCAS03_05950 [Clavibacter michiganensis subsp. michiganensis]